MEALDVPVRLRPAHLRLPVLDLLKLEDQLVGVAGPRARRTPARCRSAPSGPSSKKGSLGGPVFHRRDVRDRCRCRMRWANIIPVELL